MVLSVAWCGSKRGWGRVWMPPVAVFKGSVGIKERGVPQKLTDITLQIRSPVLVSRDYPKFCALAW